MNDFKKLVFPKRDKSKAVDRYSLKNQNMINMSDNKIRKLNNLFLRVYGHGRHPVKAHHYFLQGIIHYNVFDFDEWKEQLSDECIKDVYNIEPRLFEPGIIKEYYKKVGILEEDKELGDV